MATLVVALVTIVMSVHVIGAHAAVIVTAIGIGNLHSCAVLSDKTVDCWGRSGDGQLGNGLVTTAVSPPQPHPRCSG